MDELAGGRRRADSPPPLPILPDDLLLRLPPEPIYLFRASFVSKHWRGLVHDAGFLRRFREIHGGTPPVLGFFSNNTRYPIFVPTTGAFALSTATMRHAEWWALGCRHGRALFESHTTGLLLVWDLMTGGKRYLPLPPACEGVCQGAVLCAAGHTDHGDCRSCPFLLAYVSSRTDGTTSACICSSETGIWTEVSSIPAQASSSVDAKRMALIGSTLYGLLDDCNIFEFDLDNRRLGLTERIPDDSFRWEIIIMPTEDGLLGLAGVEGFTLHLWSMMKSICGAVTWTCQRVIDLKNFLAPEVVASVVAVEPIGFAEDAGVIFICMHPSVYMIHLKSMRIEVSKEGTYCSIFPYASFYSPVMSSPAHLAKLRYREDDGPKVNGVPSSESVLVLLRLLLWSCF